MGWRHRVVEPGLAMVCQFIEPENWRCALGAWGWRITNLLVALVLAFSVILANLLRAEPLPEILQKPTLGHDQAMGSSRGPHR
jgi:hypothetical protein